jgi:zinc protease
MQHTTLNFLRTAAAACVLAAAPAWAALPIQQWTQPSGARVWLVESHVLPMVDVQVDFDGGSRRDPPSKAGLAGVTASMTSNGLLARGGLPALDENQVSEAWADLGAGFGASATTDRLSYTLRTLTDPQLLPKAVLLAARQIGEPSFPADIWQRDRERMSASLREARTRPGTLAGLAFAKAIYGQHPYGHETTEQTLAAMTVDDMRAKLALSLAPCRAKVSIVGAVTRAQADQIARDLLARLPAASGPCTALPAVPEVAPLAAPSEQRIPFASAQAQVVIGQPGIRRADPDYFPLILGNYILGGGGFVSRLTTEIREKRGLTYGVSSYFSPGLHAGAFTVGLTTRPDQAAQAVQLVREVVARFVAEGPSAAELQAAKDFMIGGFPLRLDSNRKLLDNLASIAWHDLPLDYLDTWTSKVQAITPAQIRAAFAKVLQPDRMATVIVGAPQP